MSLDKYIELLVSSSGTTKLPIHELRFSLRQIPFLELEKLLHPNPRVRLRAIKKLVESDQNAKLPIILQLMTIEQDLEIRFYLRKALNFIEEDYPFWIQNEDLDKKLILDTLKNQKTKHKLLKLLVHTKQFRWAEYLQSISFEWNGDADIDATVLTLIRYQENSSDKLLMNYLNSKNDKILCDTIDVIGQVGSKTLLLHLIGMYPSESAVVNNQIENAIALLGKEKLLDIINNLNLQNNEDVLESICELIHSLKWDEGGSILRTLSTNSNINVSDKAKNSLVKLNSENKEALLGDQLLKVAHSMYPGGLLQNIQENLNSYQIAEVIKRIQLSSLGKQRKIRVLQYFLNFPDNRVRANVIEAFTHITNDKQKRWFLRYLNDPNNRIRGNAWVALMNAGKYSEYEPQLTKSLRYLINDQREMYQRTALYCMNSCDQAVNFHNQIIALLISPHPIVRQRSIELAMKWNLSSEDLSRLNLPSEMYDEITNQLDALKHFREKGYFQKLKSDWLADDVDSKLQMIQQLQQLPPVDFLKEILEDAWEKTLYPDVKVELLKVIQKQDSELALKIAKSLKPKGLSRLNCVAFSILLAHKIPESIKQVLAAYNSSVVSSSELSELLSQLLQALIDDNQYFQAKIILNHLVRFGPEYCHNWISTLNKLPKADESLILGLSKLTYQVTSTHRNKILSYLLRSCSKSKLFDILHQSVKSEQLDPNSREVLEIFSFIS